MHEIDFTTESHQRVDTLPRTAAQVLMIRRDKVISSWVKRTRSELSQASTLDQKSLINHLPKLVDCTVRALAALRTNVVDEESRELAHLHGSERARLSDYSPDQLVQEYRILCEVLLDEIDDDVKLSVTEFKIIYKVMGHALQDAMVAYSDIQTDFRERFIATLAHDLRNPLGVARTAAELISLECEDAQEVCFLSDRLISNLARADDLMQSLLDVAYMHSGYELHYKMEETDLSKLITETVQAMTLSHGDRFIIEGDHIIGYWNKSALRRSLENLLMNALKYGDYGKPILVEAKLAEDNVEIRIHNEGRAIPPADQKKIFQPFRREKTILTSKPGWGLGLCFVQTATEAHGGRVRVRSAENYGTDFIIDMPRDARKISSGL